MNFRLRVFTSFLVLAFSFAINPVRIPTLIAAPNPAEKPFEMEQSDASPFNETVCVIDALVVIDPALFEQLERAIQLVRDAGGCAVHIFPPQAFIGSLTARAEETLKDESFRVAVFRSLIGSDQLAGLPESAAIAAAVWNQGFNPQTFEFQAQEEPPGEPLIDDQKQVELPPARDFPAAPDAPGYYDVSDFLYGKIAVGIILPESDGSRDLSTENWVKSRMDQVISEIQSAMSWYAATFPAANLSFYYDIHNQVPTGYEPINRSSGSDTLWIKESFDSLGYTGTWSTQAYSYLNYLRSTYKTDWALVAFVVDSYNDADGKFTDGYFGYTYGFLIVMTFENDGWGISRMDSVMAHEMGHNFGAADEYCSIGYSCCWGGSTYGYLGIPNSNCEAGCDKNNNGICDGNEVTPNSNCRNCPSCAQVSCLMRSGGLNAGMDTPSRYQIGARDSDNDSLYDPVDTKPSLTMSAFSPDPTQDNTPTYTGSAVDLPYNSPTQTDISINFIERVRYQVDGGSWQECSAEDGKFDQTTELFTCQIAQLPDGERTLQFQARNRVMNVSTTWSDTLMVDVNQPTNPTSADPGCEARNNVWQNTCDDPIFTWEGARDAGTGVAGYNVYWGSDEAGTSSNFTNSPAFDPAPVPSTGTYYLRVQTRDQIGHVAPWTTLFIFRYDSNAQLIREWYLPIIRR